MSRAKNIKATPRADRLRDFVAARALDERMNVVRRSYVCDLASGAAVVDLLGSEFKIAKQMLSIGIEWLENSYDGRVSREPTDIVGSPSREIIWQATNGYCAKAEGRNDRPAAGNNRPPRTLML